MATTDSTSLLYNQTETVIYKDSVHRYYVDKRQVPSVTTVLSAVIAKPDLMLWPLNLALKQLEEILADGRSITLSDLTASRSAHIKKREHGADTGTAVHAIVEKRLNTPYNLKLDISDVPLEVGLASLAFEAWALQHQPKVIGTEQVVYSKKLKYAGTYDAILRMDNKTYLVDLKTTNASKSALHGVYPEHFIQLGAYYLAYEEQRKAEGSKTKLQPIDDLMVISAKKDGVVDIVKLSDLGHTPAQMATAWKAVLTIYIRLKSLKKELTGMKT